MRPTSICRAGAIVTAAVWTMLCPAPGHFSLSFVTSGRTFALEVASHGRVLRAVVMPRHSKKASPQLPFAVIIVTKAANSDCA